MSVLVPTPGVPLVPNLLAIAAVSGLSCYLFFLLPLLLEGAPDLWVLSILVPVLAIVPHWALVHEAIHGHLLPSRGANKLVGRLLAVLFLAPFAVLRFGHLAHHALNARAADRPELFDSRSRSRLSAAILFYPRLLGGLYLTEVASGLLSFLPRPWLRPLVRRIFLAGALDGARIAERAERQLLAAETLRAIRTDAAAVLLLLALSVQLYGENWPVLALALFGRALMVSLLDNAAHYGAPLGDADQGFDLFLPPFLAPLVLNAHLHGTHHRHPHLPWTALPAAFAADGGRFAGHFLLRPLRQFRGPIAIDQLPPSSEVRP